MKSSAQQESNSRWINYTNQKNSKQDAQPRSKIHFQHPIQPYQNNNEYQFEGLDDGQYNGSIKFQESKDKLNSPRNNEKLLAYQNIMAVTNKEPKSDFLYIKNMNFIHLIDRFQIPEENGFLTISPNSIFYKLLYIISFLMNTLVFTLIPIESLDEDYNFTFLYILCILLQIMLHMAELNVVNDGEIEGQFKKICQIYIKSYFMLDFALFISILFHIIVNASRLKTFIVISTALIIQANRYKQQQSIFMQAIQQTNRYYNIYDKSIIFSTHIVNYVMILNLLSCLLLSAVKDIDFFESTTISDQYLQSIYSVIQMNSNIIPESSSSAIGIAGINVIYIFLNAYILIQFYEFMKIDKSLTKLFSYFREKQPDLSIKIKLLNDRDKLKSFQFYKDQTEKLNEFKEKKSVLCHYFRNLSSKAINQLAAKASIENYQQNQVIIQQDEADDSSIYFVLEGNVTILSKNGTELNRLKKFNCFGELSFYTNQLRTATVVCQVYCRLLKLSRSDFLMVANLLEKQTFFYISDKILQKIKMPSQCFCCNSSDHYIHSCPKLIYHPDPLQILQNEDSKLSIIVNQEGNRQFIRNRQSKLRIPYKDLKTIDVTVYEQMRIQYQRVSSSMSSDGDLPYENDTLKYSINSSEKISISPKKSEFSRKIGIDDEFSTQFKHLKTIIENEEDIIDSPPVYLTNKKQKLVTKSQEGSNIISEQLITRSKSKSHQCIKTQNNLKLNLPVQTFQNVRNSILSKDFDNIGIENENIVPVEQDNIQNFERMADYDTYFPHYNFKNQIFKANQRIQNINNQQKE